MGAHKLLIYYLFLEILKIGAFSKKFYNREFWKKKT